MKGGFTDGHAILQVCQKFYTLLLLLTLHVPCQVCIYNEYCLLLNFVYNVLKGDTNI